MQIRLITRLALLLGSICGYAAMTLPANAADLVGFYVGAAVGQAKVDAGSGDFRNFSEDHSAFKLIGGVRMTSLFGAEVAYTDFGSPREQRGYEHIAVTMRAASAFGIVYLPIPVIDIFAKAGVAQVYNRIDDRLVCTQATPCSGVASPYTEDRTSTRFAAGVGVQLNRGPLAVRAEYERFSVPGGSPILASVGAMWSFL